MKLNPFFLILALVFGWMSLLFHPLTLDVSVLAYKLTVNWAYIFPMLIGIFYGPRYALVSCVFGLAVFYPYIHWPYYGWVNLSISLFTLFWIIWISYVHQRHTRTLKWYWHPILNQLILSVLFFPWTILSVPWISQFNPSPWYAGSGLFSDFTYILLVAFMGSLTMFLVTLVVLVFNRLNLIRQSFRIPMMPEMEGNIKIFMGGFLVFIFSLICSRLLLVVFQNMHELHLDYSFIELLSRPLEVYEWIMFVTMLVALCLMVYQLCISSETSIRTMRELMSKKMQLKKLTDTLPRMMLYQITIHPDGQRNFNYLSEGCNTLHGISINEGLADSSLIYAQIHTDYLTELIQKEDAALQKLEVFNAEVLMKPPHAEPFWALLRSKPYLMNDGSIEWYGVELDITELKRIQENLLRANDVLEQKVLERTEELSKAVVRAEYAANSKSMFLANMSHEIRTPLNAILGLSHLLMEQIKEERSQDFLTKLDLSAKSLLDVVNDILDFSKIEAGKISLYPQVFNLHKCLNLIVDMMSFNAETKGITLKLNRSAELSENVIGDEFRLRQVLLNLCSNAIKFTEQGSVEVEVIGNDDRIRFKIKDTGIGMNPEHLERIFAPFEQADGNMTRQFGGTGLGLAISDRLVQLMGGHIEVQSELGIGSRFEFEIPLARTAMVQHLENTSEIKSIIPLKILLVEDQEINQLVASEILAQYNHQVVLAENGQVALKILSNTNDIDLILMDLQMPLMDGFEATAQIRKLEQFKYLPIIALTADIRHDVMDHKEDYGFNDYLLKPFDVSHLVEVINKWTNIGSND